MLLKVIIVVALIDADEKYGDFLKRKINLSIKDDRDVLQYGK